MRFNVQKLSEYTKKNVKLIRIKKNICLINHDLAGFEPTGTCPVVVLVILMKTT